LDVLVARLLPAAVRGARQAPVEFVHQGAMEGDVVAEVRRARIELRLDGWHPPIVEPSHARLQVPRFCRAEPCSAGSCSRAWLGSTKKARRGGPFETLRGVDQSCASSAAASALSAMSCAASAVAWAASAVAPAAAAAASLAASAAASAAWSTLAPISPTASPVAAAAASALCWAASAAAEPAWSAAAAASAACCWASGGSFLQADRASTAAAASTISLVCMLTPVDWDWDRG